jgi:hypothetical protein
MRADHIANGTLHARYHWQTDVMQSESMFVVLYKTQSDVDGSNTSRHDDSSSQSAQQKLG